MTDSLAKFAVKDLSFFVVVIAGCFGWSFLMKDCFLAKKKKKKKKLYMTGILVNFRKKNNFGVIFIYQCLYMAMPYQTFTMLFVLKSILSNKNMVFGMFMKNALI